MLIHMLTQLTPKPRIFTLDTGRLNQETYDVMDTIRPFVSLTLGVVGFSLGLALRRRLLAIPALGGGFVIALGVGGLVGAVLYLGLLYLPIDPTPLEPILWPVVTIGRAAATISTAAICARFSPSDKNDPAKEFFASVLMSSRDKSSALITALKLSCM